MLKTVVLPNIFAFFEEMKAKKKKKGFPVTFDQFNVSSLNKSINLFYYSF